MNKSVFPLPLAGEGEGEGGQLGFPLAAILSQIETAKGKVSGRRHGDPPHGSFRREANAPPSSKYWVFHEKIIYSPHFSFRGKRVK
jgi:hypothetical protein